MDQDPIVPPDPQGGNSNPIDLGKILLPKKEVHAPENASRINAGALLESEQTAQLPKVPPSPLTPPPPPKNDSVVKPIETYQGDIEELVQKKNMSVVTIAAAEAAKRGTTALPTFPDSNWSSMVSKTLMVIGGVMLISAAAGVLAFLLLRPVPSVDVIGPQATPFINVDQTKVLTVPDAPLAHASVIVALNNEKNKITLSTGLLAELRLAILSSAPDTPQTLTQLPVQTVLGAIAPNAPDTLRRAVENSPYLIGVHSYEGNQAFLILHTDSYERAFAGMLGWEGRLADDLSPLFTRVVSTHVNQAPINATASTTIASSTEPVFESKAFKDAIVENHDARVVQNSYGDTFLLWTFIDRNTLVITTNEVTLREILNRIHTTAIVPLP